MLEQWIGLALVKGGRERHGEIVKVFDGLRNIHMYAELCDPDALRSENKKLIRMSANAMTETRYHRVSALADVAVQGRFGADQGARRASPSRCAIRCRSRSSSRARDRREAVSAAMQAAFGARAPEPGYSSAGQRRDAALVRAGAMVRGRGRARRRRALPRVARSASRGPPRSPTRAMAASSFASRAPRRAPCSPRARRSISIPRIRGWPLGRDADGAYRRASRAVGEDAFELSVFRGVLGKLLGMADRAGGRVRL